MIRSSPREAVSSGTPAGRELAWLLVVGLVAWTIAAIGLILWFFASVPEPGLAAVGVLFYAWPAGFIPGGVVMVLYGIIRMLRRQLRGQTVVLGAAVYFVPAVLAAGAFAVFQSSQPLAVQRGDDSAMMLAIGGVVWFALYFLATLVGLGLRNRPERQTATGIVVVPIVGAALMSLLLVWYAFSSSTWQYRDAFALSVDGVRWHQPAGLTVDATLRVNRDGLYSVHAFYEDRDRQAGTGRGAPMDEFTIDGRTYDSGQSWTKVGYELREGETYQLQFVWHDQRTRPRDEERVVVFRITEGPNYQGGTLLREFVIPIPAPDDQ